MPKPKNQPIADEKQAQHESEAMAHHASEASLDEVGHNPDEEAEKGLMVEEGANLDQAVPAEVAAIHVDNESAQDVNKPVKKKAVKAPVATKPKQGRSAKYLQAKEQIEKGKLYGLADALTLIKKVSLSSFDGAVEIHMHLTKKKDKGSTQSSKVAMHLPHGSGKERKVIVLDEAKIEEIAKTKKIDFDVAIASPELMPKVGKIAKILGPKGKMPDPKSGTVTTDPAKAMAEITSGKVEYRIDASNNVHQMIGRVSWTEDKLKENAQAVLASQPKSRISSAYVVASISPAIPIDLNNL